MKKSKKQKKPKKQRKPTINALKKKLDIIFSIYIRQRDKGVCFTCGVIKPWKEQQAGHYVSRVHNSLRFDERNVHCQCVGCNIFKHGALDVYALNLQSRYGNDILKELNQKKGQIKQFNAQELLGLIEKYSALVNNCLLKVY